MGSRSVATAPLLALALGLASVSAACGSDGDSEVATPDVTLIPRTSAAAAAPASSAEPVETAPSASEPTAAPAPTASGPSSTTAAPTTSTPPSPDGSGAPTSSDPAAAPAETASATTEPASVEARFDLTSSGIGSTTFGADPDGAVAFISSFLGEPTADTGWIDPFEVGVCDGTRLRQVSWADLQLEFGDVSDITDGRDHFSAYTYGSEGSASALPPALSTPEGITVGSTVGDLLAAYPGVTLIEGDDFVAPSFSVNDALGGRLSGLTGADVVEVVVGGLPCES
ncbi:hypothetical protein [Ilumatobacter sp.]|uniref:hypothetical protein n=1 Tax=Ilumatobacter sp. TaxID=1967498 RepID=UPI003B5253DF